MDNSKDHEIKGFFWGYIVIGCVAIIGGILSIYSRVNGITPFLFALDPTPGPILTESQVRLQALAEKKLLDSDNDGLNDFDEEFTYSTSAYLSDTDSDGTADNLELAEGTDPNCATGNVCFSTTTNTESASGNINVNAADIADLSTDDPVALRQQLAGLGIPQDVLDQVSDEDLLTVYASAQADYQGGTPITNSNSDDTDPYADLLLDTNNTNSVSSVQTLEDLQSLSPAAVRDLLIQSGMQASDLEEIDDATLMEVYQDALDQTQPQQ